MLFEELKEFTLYREQRADFSIASATDIPVFERIILTIGREMSQCGAGVRPGRKCR